MRQKSLLFKMFILVIGLILVMSMTPIFGYENPQSENEEYVYISISHDGEFIEDKNENKVAYKEVALSELEKISLDDYGLSDFTYDFDYDGNYEITALHLYIYTHINIMGMDWSDVNISGGSGSIFFESGLFGFEDCNLMYFYNGIYPEVNNWGVTADQLPLFHGDYLDIAGYTSWAFYMDSATGFHYFVDESDEITHNYSVNEHETLNAKLIRSYSDMGSSPEKYEEANYTVYYGLKVGEVYNSVITDDNGNCEISFPSTGTWYIWCNGGYGNENELDIVSSPTSAIVEVVSEKRDPQDVSKVLNETLTQLQNTVTAPAFGTNAGEWTVLSLARGDYFGKDDKYFVDYYARIEETVNNTAASVNLNGALHKRKSTDNSRLIVALSSIGKDARQVGEWNLISPYEDFTWIKYQGINGAIWALIALDSGNYETVDTTIRQQCIDYILDSELEDGGWALSGKNFNIDITGMVIQSLYPYKNQPAVIAAVERAFTKISTIQQSSGGFLYGNNETSESAAQVIVACTTWGINPDTDSRFIKNGNSVVDALLEYYNSEEKMFEHIKNAGTNGMATDQAAYALVAYDRLLNNKNSLYDMSDVEFEEINNSTIKNIVASIGLPESIDNINGTEFNGTVSINEWNNELNYKLFDMVINVPNGLNISNVTVSNRVTGGTLMYNLNDNILRIVYLNVNTNESITVTGTQFPLDLVNIKFVVEELEAGEELNISVSQMTFKTDSDSNDPTKTYIVDTTSLAAKVQVVEGLIINAKELYQGDGLDLIPENKKAIMITATSLSGSETIIYNDANNTIEFNYNMDISKKLNVVTYIALVDKNIELSNFENTNNYTIIDETPNTINFGDVNNDGVINAQDALIVINMWLRKDQELTDDKILSSNVNGDSHIDTYDVLGIIESFIYGDRTFAIVTKAIN